MLHDFNVVYPEIIEFVMIYNAPEPNRFLKINGGKGRTLN